MRSVIEHYDSLSEDERSAEIEAALDDNNLTWVAVPLDLVPEVRSLIARRRQN